MAMVVGMPCLANRREVWGQNCQARRYVPEAKRPSAETAQEHAAGRRQSGPPRGTTSTPGKFIGKRMRLAQAGRFSLEASMAAANFERAFALTLKHEGGYVDHPRDPGGATHLGITIGTLSQHLGRPAPRRS
jgi:hypothetical protein